MESTVRPNLFIAGAPKCGTTALYAYLRTHPQVFFPRRKEPRFWCSDLQVRRDRSSQQFRSLVEYQELFREAPPAATVVGEASTLYLRSEVAIPRILEFNSSARFIVMVRNPIEMFRSWHHFLFSHFIEDVRDPERAWEMQETRRRGNAIPRGCDLPEKLQYRRMVSLGEQLDRAMRSVPPQQLLVILSEDLASDPAAQYARVLRFLDLEQDGRAEFPFENRAAEYRASWLARSLHDPPRFALQSATWLRRRFPATFSSGARSRLLNLLQRGTEKRALSSAFRRRLEVEMREEMKSLSKSLGRDVDHWIQPDCGCEGGAR